MTIEKTSKWRVLIDLNVILDVLMRREPHLVNAARIWTLVETGMIEGFIAAHSFTTLFYLYRKQTNSIKAYQAIRQLLRVFRVASIDQTVIEMACDLGWRDFEDSVQWFAANEASCHYVVSRNAEDFVGLSVPVIPPAEFLAIWSAYETRENL